MQTSYCPCKRSIHLITTLDHQGKNLYIIDTLFYLTYTIATLDRQPKHKHTNTASEQQWFSVHQASTRTINNDMNMHIPSSIIYQNNHFFHNKVSWGIPLLEFKTSVHKFLSTCNFSYWKRDRIAENEPEHQHRKFSSTGFEGI